MFEIYKELFKLKNLIRKGWQYTSVQGRLESDAEHTFSMLVTALEILSKAKHNLDELKVLKMITYHDLGEIDAGDFTPKCKITKEEKFEKEYACIKRLSTEYEMPEIETLWLEFESGETPEARFVKALDKFDAIKQAEIYSEKQNRPEIYEEFYEYSKKYFNYIKDFGKED